MWTTAARTIPASKHYRPEQLPCNIGQGNGFGDGGAVHGWKDGQVRARYGGRHDGACLLLWRRKRGIRSVSRSDTNAWYPDLLGLVSVFHPWLFQQSRPQGPLRWRNGDLWSWWPLSCDSWFSWLMSRAAADSSCRRELSLALAGLAAIAWPGPQGFTLGWRVGPRWGRAKSISRPARTRVRVSSVAV